MDVSWRPTPDRDPKRFASDAEALRRAVGGCSVSFGEPVPGVLIARVGLRPLPTRDVVNATAETEAEPLDLGWIEPVASAPVGGPARFIIGRRAGGGVCEWVPSETPHLLAGGSTGSGKGGACRLILSQALAHGWRVFAIDLKQSGEHRWLADHGVRVAHTPAEAVEVLTDVAVEMGLRQGRLWDRGADKLADLGEGDRPILLLVDEAQDLLVPTRVNDDEDALRRQAGDLLGRVAAKGRSAAVHLLVALQRPDVAALGPSGGALRGNLKGRLAIGTLDADGLQMMFGAGASQFSGSLTGVPGRALAAGLQRSDGPSPYETQILWVPGEVVRPEGSAVAA